MLSPGDHDVFLLSCVYLNKNPLGADDGKLSQPVNAVVCGTSPCYVLVLRKINIQSS